jgi:4-amino-4-deoxy-L-arabinose transferase-like glycosyltransferase
VCTAALGVGLVTIAGIVSSWLRRGENAQGIATLTGRTNFWALVISQPRNGFQRIFGFGLSNASVNGLPIDSNWLASYMMEGLFGAVVCAMILLWLFLRAFFQSRGIYRALALFLVTYCTVASYTEVGFTDVSTYLLHLAIAASLLIAPKVYSGMTESY